MTLTDTFEYRPAPHGLRHPQIFYYCHTACLYVNKLRLAGLLSEPVNPRFESIFEVGVDEMLWDDMDKNDMEWPTVLQVWQYRQQVYKTVKEDVIEKHFLVDTPVHISQDSPLWALFLSMEHERIHMETSSVLFRETPHHLVQTPNFWPSLHESAWSRHGKASQPIRGRDFPSNEMVHITSEKNILLGKPKDFPSFGWDNEYGTRERTVPPFAASKYMISNGEFWEFVSHGAGYSTRAYWCDAGWAWKSFRNAKWPYFWLPTGPEGYHEYNLRTIFHTIPMPWDWPVDVSFDIECLRKVGTRISNSFAKRRTSHFAFR